MFACLILLVRNSGQYSGGTFVSRFSSCDKPNACYRFVKAIMNVTAAVAIVMPIIMLAVRASPKTIVPTRMAVIGSNTPSTEAFVAPMFLVATARVAVETIVGRIANPIRFAQSAHPLMPVVIFSFDIKIKNHVF